MSEHAVSVVEVDMLTALAVASSLDPTATEQRLLADGLARAGGDATHVWLDVSALKARAEPVDADGAEGVRAWGASYDAMISYARRKGWTSPDGTLVRAHLEQR
ncbi:hypothetical protein FXB39_04025 [Nocardioides sp. BGMRC 2183]|nr:hypothetical protein FXB39_04025 [Nocardioides sp. BGMRC 2183]